MLKGIGMKGKNQTTSAYNPFFFRDAGKLNERYTFIKIRYTYFFFNLDLDLNSMTHMYAGALYKTRNGGPEIYYIAASTWQNLTDPFTILEFRNPDTQFAEHF